MTANRHGLLLLTILAACNGGDDHDGAYQGVVELEERVLAFEVPGHVEKLHVTEGDEVAADQPLVELDATLETIGRDARASEARAARAELDLLEAGSRPEDVKAIRAELRSAIAAQKLARSEAQRQRDLFERGVTSVAQRDTAASAADQATARRSQLEQQFARARHGARAQEIEAASARLEAAESAVRASNERIARHVLSADGPGLVLDVHLELGEFAAVGAPVVTVADVHHPYVDVFVPQADIAGVRLGGAASISVDSLDHPLPGSVEHIGRQTEFTPRFVFSERERTNLVIRVRVRIDDAGAELRAGVPAFATFGTGAGTP